LLRRGGKPIGEIGTDAEASPGNGPYYVKLYDGSYDAVGFDTAEEALAELKYAVKQMAEGSLTEFAPSDSGDGGGDDDGFDEDTLRKLAAQWFAGDEDPQVERLLAAAGWEIGQDEGYDDEPGVFVVMSGDDDGRSYMSWPAEELRSAMSEGVTEGSAGWMLRQDPALAKKVRANTQGYKDLKKMAGKPVPNKDEKGVAEDDMSALAGYAAGIVGGAAVPFAAGSLAIKFRDALRSTDELAKRKARVDTAEIIALQKQIVSINKMLGRVKTDETKEKYQAMLKTAYEVLDELKARQDNNVAEGSDDELNARPGMWRGNAKRMTAKGKPTKDELGMQDNLKNRIKASNRKGGLTGPKGVLPEQGVAEGRAGVDDVDTVGFSVNSEAAYNAVMRRFGDYIDHDETSGIMSAPARIWPEIEMVAFDADPDSGAVRVEDDVMEQGVAEAKSLARRVRVVKTGETGTIRQIKHGAYKGAPKTYYVDLDNGGQADNLPASALRLIKGEVAEVKSKTHSEHSEMDTPAVQRAIAGMKQRHEKDTFDLEKARALGQKLASRNRDPRRK
jgi:hypothetical protein